MPSLAEYPQRCCPVCAHTGRKAFRPGPDGRPDARCPRCRSLERHRFLAVLLDCLRPALGDVDVLLDIAPYPLTTQVLQTLAPRRHLRLDLGLDNRLVDALADLTALPVADGSVDLVMCYHVLEHVPDDRRAMREIARVLAPGGLALVQVPIRFGTVTDEDPDADEDERTIRFGQRDHVRFYGDDFEDRLEECGLSFQRVTPLELLGEQMCEWLRLSRSEPVWLVRAGPHRAGAHLASSYLPHLLDGVLGRMADHHRERERARRRVRRLLRRAESPEALPVRRSIGHRLLHR
ncbi:MAG: class I SAM-dependent methyltransferase [Nocardioides sp.]